MTSWTDCIAITPTRRASNAHSVLREPRSNGYGHYATTSTTTPHAPNRSAVSAAKASENGRPAVDDQDEPYSAYLVHRLRNASILDKDIYQLLHAAAHRIEHLENRNPTLPKEPTS